MADEAPERADPVVPGQARGMLDADEFLAFTQRLRAIHERVDEADVSDKRQARWQRRLLDITDAARTNLDHGEQQLRRFEAELDEHLSD
ncbi:MAG: hypothetical protein R3343_04960 [Nitriliruptorales bacterium]|nr:hypothetical protein [Nitriliruptorales bacterium]